MLLSCGARRPCSPRALLRAASLLALAFLCAGFFTSQTKAEPLLSESLALDRFWNAKAHDHIETTADAAAPTGYVREGILGYLLPIGGSSRMPLYTCLVGGSDYMLSNDRNCEGQRVVRLDGY